MIIFFHWNKIAFEIVAYILYKTWSIAQTGDWKM